MNELLNLVKCCEYGNLTAINDLKFPWQEMECGLEAEQKKNGQKHSRVSGKKHRRFCRMNKGGKRCQLK